MIAQRTASRLSETWVEKCRLLVGLTLLFIAMALNGCTTVSIQSPPQSVTMSQVFRLSANGKCYDNYFGEACQGLRALIGAGFSNQEINNWGQSGLTVSEAIAWHQTAFTSFDFQTARSMNFSLEDATRWRDAGISLEDAKADLAKYPGITPQEAGTLKNHGIAAKDCADQQLSYQETLEWEKQGFSCVEAGPWHAADASPERASEWKAARLSADSYYLSKDEVSPQTAAEWQAAGVQLANKELVTALRGYLSKGYALKKAAYYASRGVQLNQVAEYNRVAATCHGSYKSFVELAYMSPFATTGKCFNLYPVVVQQWLTSKTALANVGGLSALVEFKIAPTSAITGGTFLGMGAYQYSSASGVLETVARLKWLGQTVAR